MPIVKVKTNLKSLQYGNDRIGGGSSNQPYIQTPIPDRIGGSGFLDALNEDFILRGGTRAVTDSVIDIKRLSNFFLDRKDPSGLLFTAKQNLLSRTAVRTQASRGVFLNDGIYTPLSTLAQAGGEAFGLHVNKQGLNPFDGIGSLRTYNDVVNPEIGGIKEGIRNKDKNRLIELYKNSIISINSSPDIRSYPGGPNSILGIGKTNIKFADQRTGINSFNKKGEFEIRKNLSLGNNLSTTKIDQYLDKDGSYNSFPTDPYQQINRFFKLSTLNGFSSSPYWKDLYFDLLYSLDQQTASKNQNRILRDVPIETLSTDSKNSQLNNNNTFTYTQENLSEIEKATENNPKKPANIGSSIIKGTIGVGDFRAYLRKTSEKAKEVLPISPNYSGGDEAKNIEKRVGLGDPGNAKGKNLISYVTGSGGKSFGAASPDSYDKINASKIDSEFQNDLVKFRIEVINNDTPSNTTKIQFRAFLNQISDSYTADWQDTKYIGRGEKFYTYTGFDRKVSLSWTVAAQSKVELIPMYKKLNYLASVCAPDYSGKGYMRGNIVKLTVGGYFFEQPGIITGFSYEMNDDNATWEIGIPDEDGISPFYDSSVKELPHLIKVSSFNFIPIHTFVPRLVQNPNVGTEERYIALANGTNLTDTNYQA